MKVNGAGPHGEISMNSQDAYRIIQERRAHYASMRPFNVVKALERTRASINALISRGGTLNSLAGQTLVDRYGDLKESLCSNGAGERRRAWDAYCEASGAVPCHTGYDLFA